MKDSFKQKTSLEKIIEDIFHPNPYINNEAYLLMSKHYARECMEILILTLKGKDIYLRRKSILALGQLGENVFLPISGLYKSCQNNEIKTSCIKVFIKVFVNYEVKEIPDEVINLIDLALKDDSMEITLSVISLLRQMGTEGIARLMKACKDKNILRAKAAISALAEIGDAKVIYFLKKLAEDESFDPILRDDLLFFVNEN